MIARKRHGSRELKPPPKDFDKPLQYDERYTGTCAAREMDELIEDLTNNLGANDPIAPIYTD